MTRTISYVRYTISAGNLSGIGYTEEQLDQYESELEDALIAAYPGAEIEVVTVPESGATARPLVFAIDEDGDTVPEGDAVPEINDLANRVLEAL